MTLKEKIQKYFRRKAATQTPQQEGQGVEERSPLRIEGVKPAPLTPEPDDAELAAQALLESMCDVRSKKEDVREVAADVHQPIPADAPTRSLSSITNQPSKSHQPSVRDASYYRALADRIRTARTAEARLVMRLLASVEEQLSEPTALYKGQWGDTERKLYRAMDIAEREGGELHRRWQHCLANVLVRRMEEEREATEDGRRKMEDGSGDDQTETPYQNPTEGRTTNPTEGRLAMPTEGRPADTTLETSSQTVLPVTEAAINQP
jgi:hypothetical protein